MSSAFSQRGQVPPVPELNKKVGKFCWLQFSGLLCRMASLLGLFPSLRPCTQPETRIYCHFVDDSRGSDLLSQKNNESSAQSTVKCGLRVAFFPRLAIYLRTVRYIMSINAHKSTGRRCVDISNPEQILNAFSEIDSNLALPPFGVFT